MVLAQPAMLCTEVGEALGLVPSHHKLENYDVIFASTATIGSLIIDLTVKSLPGGWLFYTLVSGTNMLDHIHLTII